MCIQICFTCRHADFLAVISPNMIHLFDQNDDQRRERTQRTNERRERPPRTTAETTAETRRNSPRPAARDGSARLDNLANGHRRQPGLGPGLGPAAKSSYRRRSVCSVGLGGMSAILGPGLWSESQTTMVLLRNPHCIKPARSHFFSRTKGVCQRRRHPSPLGPLAGSTGRIGCV